MTINGYRFLYANQVSDGFDVIMCDIGNPNTETNDEETNIISSKNAFKDTWDFHGLEYTSPLKFNITIADPNGEYIDTDRQRALKKWLCKNSYNWLQVEQDDMSNIEYFCILTNPRPVDVGRLNAGLSFQVTCNSPFAWSKLYKKTYTATNNSLAFNININSDFDDYIVYPILKITALSSGDISIKNNTIDKTLAFNNCTINEVITVDCKNDIIESSNNRILIDNWNKNFIEMVDGNNCFTLTGDFKTTIEYRLPIRVGG